MKMFDGKKIRDSILNELKAQIIKLPHKPRLAVIWVGEDLVTARYVEAKQKAAEKIGICFDLIKYSVKSNTTEIEKRIEKLNSNKNVDGIMIQIPLPENIDMIRLIEKIDSEKDVDALRFCAGLSCNFHPPVTLAILEAINKSKVNIVEKKVAQIGKGFLVGVPMIKIISQVAKNFKVADTSTCDIGAVTSEADIVISAVGKAGLIGPEIVKKGVVLIDAGTSEIGGSVVGDIDPKAFEKASFYTPVPGGIGPVTVAMLFRNVVEATKKNRAKNG